MAWYLASDIHGDNLHESRHKHMTVSPFLSTTGERSLVRTGDPIVSTHHQATTNKLLRFVDRDVDLGRVLLEPFEQRLIAGGIDHCHNSDVKSTARTLAWCVYREPAVCELDEMVLGSCVSSRADARPLPQTR